MWQTVDYEGNTVKWYEAELIERIKTICEKGIQDNISGLQDFCIDCVRGKANMALTILDLIQENEK